MACYSCHSAWVPTCFGCHLEMTANQKMPMLHNEGLATRNWTSYNFQILRDDIYMLGVDGTVTGNRIAPVLSACAVLCSSQNGERVVNHGGRLAQSYHHSGKVLDVQVRGEYLYADMGEGGIRIFDVANIDNKDFSERMITAPVSPLGQKFYVKTKYAQAIASPSTLAIDPLRTHRPENEEQRIHPMYGFLYVADKYEGLVVIGNPDLKAKTPGVGTLLDGDPNNNFLKRALAFNPNGILTGARRIAFLGTYAYMLCERGLVVVDLDNPLQPKITAQIGAPELENARGIGIQFRYAFVVDRSGLKVLNITRPSSPVLVQNAEVPMEDARNIYLARTYAYVAAGT